MATLIQLPEGRFHLKVEGDDAGLSISRAEPPSHFFAGTFFAAGVMALLMAIYLYLVFGIIGVPSLIWYGLHPLLFLLIILILIGMWSGFFEPLLFRSSRISMSPQGEFQCVKRFAGNWETTATLRPPLELHVVLDWEENTRADIRVEFFLQPADSRNSNRKWFFRRWIRLVPDTFWIRGVRMSLAGIAHARSESERMAISQASPLGDYVLRTFGIPVVYARAGGGIIERLDPVS